MEELTAELETNKRELARLGDTVEENRKEMKAVKADIAHISLGRMDKIGRRHKQELVEQLSQPTSAHAYDERMAEYQGKRRKGALELVRLAQVIFQIRFAEFTNTLFFSGDAPGPGQGGAAAGGRKGGAVPAAVPPRAGLQREQLPAGGAPAGELPHKSDLS